MPQSVAYDRLKQQLKLRLAEVFEGDTERGAARGHPNQEQVRMRLQAMMRDAKLNGLRVEGLSAREEEQLIADVGAEFTGLGPIESLMADPTVSEIMINGPTKVFVERNGKLERTPIRFQDTAELIHWIERALDRLGQSVNESEPFIDATLPEGARLNVIIAPLAPDGPVVTLRKKLQALSLDDLVKFNSLTPVVAAFLKACVQAKVNIVISGGTSTGKTTLVSILSTFMPPEERIITIESNTELDLPGKEHWIRLVSRPGNAERRGEVTIRDLVKNALRMRPDRIILGEARGGEALDMIQAMHVGHEGFFTVMHANSPQAALERLEILMLMSGLDLPVHACRVQIGSAIELVIHLERFIDGARQVAAISQVVGASETGFVVEDLFQFTWLDPAKASTTSGELIATGVRPRFLNKFHAAHVTVDEQWFTPPTGAVRP